MTTEAPQSAEADAGEVAVTGPGGFGARAKGYRLVDLIWLPLCLGMGYIALTLYNHKADAADASKAVAQALKESNHEVAKALRESNASTIEALKVLTAEQRKSTIAMKETACLLDPTMRNRSDAREFCKRMANHH